MSLRVLPAPPAAPGANGFPERRTLQKEGESMSFRLYTGNKLEKLAEKFIGIISASPPRDVFTPETVVVQTQGMAAWLKLRVGDGGRIAANFDTPFLVNFVNRTLETLFPSFRADYERFSAEVLPWRICRLLEETPEAYPELASYLAPPQRELKRWQLSCRIAELFDQYQIYRPEMLEKWRMGQNAEWNDAEWQKRLYCELRGNARTRESCFTEFFKLSDAPPGVLPERITMFGVGTMPPLFLNFFLKLSEFTEILFFYLNPSREYWGEQYSDAEAARLIARDGGELGMFHDGNPLLASFGAQGREFFRYMSGTPEVIRPAGGELFEPFLETKGDGPDDYVNPTRLTALQQDIYAMFRRAPGGDGEITGKPFVFPEEDRSIRVHNCHSARREVEVLHDQLLELLGDPAVQPRDIIVMAPDINTYAPYIRSIFGQGPLKHAYAVSDRSLRRASRIAECFFELLKLRSGRVEASKILEFLHLPALRNRFGISADELETVAAWIGEAGIRWGVDGGDRRKSCAVAFDEYSWRQGLDRLLLGFARDGVPEDLRSDGLLPLEAVGDGDAALLGRFISAVETMFALRRDCAASRTPEEWSALLLKAVDDLFLASEEEFDELAALRRAVLLPGRQAAAAGFTSALPAEVIEEVTASALATTGRNDPFLRGKITFCSLVPMRSIPMAVVAILGLNDGEFPRRDLKLGFNLVNRKIAPCDRSRQAEDRYLFLEAIQSARRCLMLFYQGQTARGNDEFPPAIPLGELIDYLKASAPFRETRHRLQPFEFSYFNRNNPDPDARSRSPENFEAARTLLDSLRDATPAPEPEPELRLPEPPAPPAVTPAELERFFTNPCRWFLNNRAGIFLRDAESGPEDTEPTPESMDRLQQYLLKTEIGAYTLDELDRDTQYRLLRRGCRLPVGRGGELLFDELYESVSKIPEHWKKALREREPFAVDLGAGGFRIAGTLEAAPEGNAQHLLFYSGFKLKYAVRALLRHMLLTLAHTGPVTTAVLNFERGEPVERFLDPTGEEAARQALEAYMALFREGMTHPLPFFEKASWAYRERGFDAARRAFCVSFKAGGILDDLDDPAIRRCYGVEAFDDPRFAEEFAHCADTLLGAFRFREAES
ncbi:MAG: exodeoxyribonuclease V subunit gamma [Lentisphaeria bacterium]|nr:exodeoxyribonuclease V subunit gamma [Lentisphaeria bacterium]